MVQGHFSHLVKPARILGITISHMLFHPGASSKLPGNASTSDDSSKKHKFDPCVPPATPPPSEISATLPSLPAEPALQQLQDSLMNSPPPEMVEPASASTFTQPSTSTAGAGPSSKKCGKRKATELDL